MVGGLLAGVCYMPLMGVSIEVKQFYKVKTIAMCWRYIRYTTKRAPFRPRFFGPRF